MSLSLNCLVLGDQLKRIFTVELPATENVSVLKDLIKKKKAPHLDHVAASDLDLWQVSFRVDGLQTELGNIDLSVHRKLSPPIQTLATFFTDVADDCIHVIAKVPGRSSEWTVDERLPLLCENKIPPWTLSKIAKMSSADLHNAELHRFINYNCPREVESISLVLLSEVFGQFKDDCTREPDSEMSGEMARYAQFAIGMAVELSKPRGNNWLNVTDLFEILYGVRLTRPLPGNTAAEHVRNGRLQLLIQLKNHNPSGDALVQGANLYRCFYVDCFEELDCLPEGDVLPAFLITCQGPLINVYGIACVEKGQVQCEYLTSVNAGCHWTNVEEQYKLVRILYALRKAFDRLNKLPELPEAPASPPRKRQKMTQRAQGVWPYPRTFTKLGSDTIVEFRYLERIDGERLLFKVQPVDEPASKKLLVKFTRSYGRAVHEELARSKYAPELLGFSYLPGGWKMVVMEYLAGPVWKDGWSLSVGDLNVFRQGLEVVRSKILPLLKEKGYVHGDIRPGNLMFRMYGMCDESNPAVKLLDFDFAGDAGKAIYPWDLNVNPECRVQAQKPCAPLEFAHDEALLDMILL